MDVNALTTKKNMSTNKWKASPGRRMDGKLTNTSDGRITNEFLNLEQIDAKSLSPGEIWELFVQFRPSLQHSVRGSIIKEIIDEEEIDGEVLIKALRDDILKKRIIKTLKLNLKTEIAFDEMLEALRRIQGETQNGHRNKDDDIMEITAATRKPQQTVQNVSNSECVIEEMQNTAQIKKINKIYRYEYNGIIGGVGSTTEMFLPNVSSIQPNVFSILPNILNSALSMYTLPLSISLGVARQISVEITDNPSSPTE